MARAAGSGRILTIDVASPRRMSAGTAARRTRRPLLDPEGPYSIAAICKSFVAVAGVMPELVAAFRSGGPVPWESYSRDMVET